MENWPDSLSKEVKVVDELYAQGEVCCYAHFIYPGGVHRIFTPSDGNPYDLIDREVVRGAMEAIFVTSPRKFTDTSGEESEFKMMVVIYVSEVLSLSIACLAEDRPHGPWMEFYETDVKFLSKSGETIHESMRAIFLRAARKRGGDFN